MSTCNVLLLVSWIAIAFALIQNTNVDSDNADIRESTYLLDHGDDTFHLIELPGNLLEKKISRKSIEKAPAWNYANGNPPLNAREVLEIADDIHRSQLPKIHSCRYELTSIKLLPLCSDSAKWCWQINFLPCQCVDECGLGGDVLFYVLMDGTVLEPTYWDGDLSKKCPEEFLQ
jgi:hypothetical protein